MEDLYEVLNRIAELLYQEKRNDAYGLLIKCLPVLSLQVGHIQDENMQIEIMEVLKTALEAMEADDATLLADILQYELLPRLEEQKEE